MALIQFEGVGKVYGAGEARVEALADIGFEIEKGELVVILGPSGAGKSTLLNLLAGMDSPSSGRIAVGDAHITGYNQRQLADYRAKHIGFVFQFYNLIGTLTALENVRLVQAVNRDALDAQSTLALVGLSKRLHQFPAQLSGGEQQRVSIARAVAKNPTLLLCDEPTGALDTQTGASVLALLQRLCREQGKTVVIVTHNQLLEQIAHRVIRLSSGRVARIDVNARPREVGEVSW